MEKKNNWLNILKKLLIAIGIVVIISVITTIGIGNYFVNYAILRMGNGGDREVKNKEVVEVASIDNETERIIEENREEEKQLANQWSNTIKNEKVEITANDGITLKGTEYIKDEQINDWVIVLHGYRSNPESVISIGRHFSEKGYNVLIPYMRATGESEGKYIGMGWLDKDDLKCWIDLIIKQNNNSNIILHGSSMGAATVLMASGDELPSNVKAIIEDSGYTSVWDIFASEAKARFNLPAFPVLNMFEIVANFRAKYDIKEASALEQVKKATVPILFIHGDNDDFVPEYMCEKLYEAANCKKDKLIIHSAGHTESRYKEPETYYNKIFEFLSDIKMMKKYCELKNEERRINMKIEQQNQIKEFLNEEFGVDKGKELFNKQEMILDEIIKNIKNKSENQRKTLIQTILPRIALYKAMLQDGLPSEDVYKHMQKYMMDIVAKQKHLSMVKMEKIPCFYFLYSNIFLKVVRKTDLWESTQKHGKDYFDVTMKKCLWHTACVENACAELCHLFCDVDNVTYGELKKLGFSRTKTLGYGGDCCDFHFYRK